MPFYRCPRFVPSVEFTQLYSPLYLPPRGFWFMQYLLHRIFGYDFEGMSLEVRSEFSGCGYQRQDQLFHLWVPLLCSPQSSCDAPFSGGPLTTRQLAEYKWISGYSTPLQKIWVESPLYGELYPIYNACMNLSHAVQYNHNNTNMDKNGLLGPYYNIHKNIPTMDPLYPIVLRVQLFYSYTIYTLNLKSSNTCMHQSHNPAFF